MLVQFAVENYRSFKDKTILSMVASDDQRHPQHVCAVVGGLRVLRCALLYGANASGKSNLVDALYEGVRLVTKGIRPGEQIRLTPFRFAEGEPQAATRFEFEVALGARRYSYGIVVTEQRVESEWLYVTEDGQERMYFERIVAPGRPNKAEIRLGDVFGEHQQRVEYVAQSTRAEQPFLTESDEREVAPIKVLAEWFREQVYIIGAGMPYQGLAVEACTNERFRQFLGEMLRSAGTGIDALEVETRPIQIPNEKESHSLSSAARRILARGFHELGTGVRHIDGDRHEIVSLLADHRLPGGRSVKFELSDLSDGTVRLLHLAPALYFLREQPSPCVFAIDELERSLHPLLTRLYLEQFLSLVSAGAGGQIICTTHDTNLLTLSLLRPDEIWFLEKDAARASRLYSLAEFKPEQLQRLGDNLEDGYLNGRFGAIPFLGTPAQLGIERKSEGR